MTDKCDIYNAPCACGSFHKPGDGTFGQPGMWNGVRNGSLHEHTAAESIERYANEQGSKLSACAKDLEHERAVVQNMEETNNSLRSRLSTLQEMLDQSHAARQKEWDINQALSSRLDTATLRFEHEERLRRAAEAGSSMLGKDLLDEMRKNSELLLRLGSGAKLLRAWMTWFAPYSTSEPPAVETDEFLNTLSEQAKDAHDNAD